MNMPYRATPSHIIKVNYLGGLLVLYLFIVTFALKLCSTSFVLGQHNIKL